MRHVVIADDNAMIRQELDRAFAEQGWKVSNATDGADALCVIRAGSPITAVVMDLQMPRMNGVLATRQLRSEGFSVPIFAFTGMPDALREDRQFFNLVLVKPISSAEVIQIVTRAVEVFSA